jgi:hypothetical protein
MDMDKARFEMDADDFAELMEYREARCEMEAN